MAPTSLHVLAGSLPARPPFEFARTLRFLGAFTPMADRLTIADGALTGALTLDGRAVAFTVRAGGSAERPAVAYRFAAERPLNPPERRILEDRVAFFLSLDDDLAPFYGLAERDPVFAPVAARLRGLHQPKFLTPFENAAWAVLTQRTPLPVAHAAKARLLARYGTAISLDGVAYRAFPEPARLAEADAGELADLVGGERKADYLRAVADFFARTDEASLRHGDYDDVAARLRAVRGLGAWSVSFVMVRGLGRTERVAAPEPALARAAGRLYAGGRPLAPDQLRRLLDRYGPHQGYWAFYVRNAGLDDSRAPGAG